MRVNDKHVANRSAKCQLPGKEYFKFPGESTLFPLKEFIFILGTCAGKLTAITDLSQYRNKLFRSIVYSELMFFLCFTSPSKKPPF